MENEAKDKVIDEVNKYSRDEEVIQIYTKLSKEEMERNTFIEEARSEGLKRGIEEGLEQGIQQGLEQGIIEGAKNEKLEIAKLMSKDRLSFDTISKYTGLTIDEIEDLSES